MHAGRVAASRAGRLAAGILAVTALSAGCTATTPAPTSVVHSAAPAPMASRSAPVVITVGVAKWHLPEPISRAVAMPAGAGSVVLASGLTSAGSSTAVERIDLATGRLRPAGRLAEAVHDAGGAQVDGVPTVFGGGSSSVGALVQVPSAKVIASLPTPRADLTAVTQGGTAYLIGGYDGTAELRSVLATTDGRSFRRVARLLVTVRYTAVTASAGRIWVFGGEHDGVPVRTIQEIDPTTGKVTRAGRLPVALSAAAAFDIAGRLLIAGGRGPTGAVRRGVYEFDPVTRSIRVVARLAVPVANAACAVVGGRGYLFGGEQGDPAGRPVSTVQTISATSR